MKHINIIFEADINSSRLEFVKVEDDDGKSIDTGEWLDHNRIPFGRKLRIPIAGEVEK